MTIYTKAGGTLNSTAFSSEALSVIVGFLLLVDIIAAVAIIVAAIIYLRKGRK